MKGKNGSIVIQVGYLSVNNDLCTVLWVKIGRIFQNILYRKIVTEKPVCKRIRIITKLLKIISIATNGFFLQFFKKNCTWVLICALENKLAVRNISSYI